MPRPAGMRFKAPVRRSGDKSGHNRFLLDVGEGCMEMRFVANE
jgi:hypothetical protein